MKETTKTKISDFLNSLKCDNVDISYYVNIEDIDMHNAYDSIYQMIDDGGGFDVEIIYYSRAIEFLRENDPSLRNSLQIAEDLGYSPSQLNSEILASILAGDVAQEEFNDLRSEIESFFEEIREEEEEEEEEKNQ